MAGRGPLPKDPATRRRTNKTPPRTAVKAPASPQLAGVDLPAGVDWHERTRIWWDNWRRAPQAGKFQPGEWDFLLETALLHTAFWNGDLSRAGELRLRAAKFGVTPEDRARLRLDILPPDAPARRATPPKDEQSISERRRRAMALIRGEAG